MEHLLSGAESSDEEKIVVPGRVQPTKETMDLWEKLFGLSEEFNSLPPGLSLEKIEILASKGRISQEIRKRMATKK